MYTIEQLSAFVAVYDAGSYSQAAKQLKKSRATVRELVLSLEDVFGFELFEIQGRKAVATDRAEKLVIQARAVTRHNFELLAHGKALFDSQIQELNIGYDLLVPSAMITAIETAMLKAYPYITVNWRHRTYNAAIESISRGELDFILSPYRVSSIDDPELDWVSLGSTTLGCFVGKGSALVKRKELRLIDLENEVQYLSENLQQFLGESGNISHQRRVVSNHDMLCEMVKQCGWAAMPHHYMAPHLESGDIVEIRSLHIPALYHFDIHVFFRENFDLLPQEKRKFIEFCRLASAETLA